ncbi:MAG: BolA/IbaG family iron-sulfur metabolism protein [Gammaproteobacteria bacterium]|nr:BolA/IbaG family iron-sulfur metabolism protein [Gammaproteobacteria bacterium]MCP5423770.1 BolA/IbaG family iron-sulfur metabolism protein [Gammaproteobacteria bacterium]
MQASEIESLIKEGLPGAQQVTVRGDDGVHFEATVVSEAFNGKSLLQQHRLVYATLGRRLNNEEIHALALKTYTPTTWQQKQS